MNAVAESTRKAGSRAILVEHLTKDFRLHHRSLGTLKAQTISTMRRLLTMSDQSRAFDVKRALDDVSFEIRAGEVVGLLGSNGSGKSTLLSILSRIYLPTSGQIRYWGRLASLLELGIGFNYELTGTENLFFACQLRGLSNDEVIRRYPSIIEFAELDETTMAQPVRSYSSGMQARLAFAAAINVDADLILVDEALAVGDVGFQEKCFAKLREYKDAGKTIVLVTHRESEFICKFADRCLWLDHGKLMGDGAATDVVRDYEAFLRSHDHTSQGGSV